MSWDQVLTSIVALYGAILSTYNLIESRKSRRRQVRVRLSHSIIGTDPEPTEAVTIEASNPGDRTVTLSGARLALPNRHNWYFVRTQGTMSFPHELQEGKSGMIWVSLATLRSELRETGLSGKISIRAVVHDPTGGEYASKPLTVDLDPR